MRGTHNSLSLMLSALLPLLVTVGPNSGDDIVIMMSGAFKAGSIVFHSVCNSHDCGKFTYDHNLFGWLVFYKLQIDCVCT